VVGIRLAQEVEYALESIECVEEAEEEVVSYTEFEKEKRRKPSRRWGGRRPERFFHE